MGLLDHARFGEPSQDLLGQLVPEPQRLIDRDALVHQFVGGDVADPVVRLLGGVGGYGFQVEPGDLGDLVRRDVLALRADGAAHPLPLVLSVQQQHLAPALCRLAVAEDPQVSADAGVVENVVGQRDHGLEPVVLHFAGPRTPDVHRGAVEDDRDSAAALARGAHRLHLRQHVLQEEQ